MKKFLIVFPALALLFLGYLGWLNRNDGSIRIKVEGPPSTNKSSETNSEDTTSPEDYFPTAIPEPEPGGFQDVSNEDCKNECEAFSVEKELIYCQEVCGLKMIEKPSSGCETLSEIEKDYCLKDMAVSQKDFKTCEEIQDSNIKKTCQNRVTEDILDQ